MLDSGVQVVLLTDDSSDGEDPAAVWQAWADRRRPAPQAARAYFQKRAQFPAMVAGFLPPAGARGA